MEAPLTFDYDEAGDILYISKVPPYPEQETEQLAYNMAARRNPKTDAVENLEVLFFARWLLKVNSCSVILEISSQRRVRQYELERSRYRPR